MKRLSKEKRQRLILTGLVTLTILAGLWYGLIRVQQGAITKIADRKANTEKELFRVKETIARAAQIEKELQESSAILAKCEESIASGDVYAWVITKIREFKTPYKIDVPQFSQVDGPRDMNLLPNFPYQQASLTIAGSGRFNDIGTFIADFENRFPFTRLCNLTMEPANLTGVGDKEKLAFHVDIVMLVKPVGETAN